jgi:hypothetical protein
VRGRRFDLPGALSDTTGVTLLCSRLVQGPEAGLSVASTSTSIGAAVGLALRVLVARRRGLHGEALHTARADGLRSAVLVVQSELR